MAGREVYFPKDTWRKVHIKNTEIECYLRPDNTVPIVYSFDYGSAWTDEYNCDDLYRAFCETIIIDFVHDKHTSSTKIRELISYLKIFHQDASEGDLLGLTIEYVPINTLFHIHNYDGQERIECILNNMESRFEEVYETLQGKRYFMLCVDEPFSDHCASRHCPS